MNSGQDPLLLPPTQLSFASNLTVRNGFAQDRPPFTNKLTIVYPSAAVQTAVEQGLWQGGCYYQPDSGPQSLIVSISGNLYQFLVNGNTVTVYDRTIVGDSNPASSTQAWPWQSEKWVIINDGSSLPIFFDGATSRRSNGLSVELNTATGTNPVLGQGPPVIGNSVTLNLTNNWASPYDFPVLFNGAYYQPIKGAGGSADVTLVSLFSNLGEAINVNDTVTLRPSVIGVVANGINGLAGNAFVDGNAFPAGFGYYQVVTGNATNLTITLTAPYTGITDPRGAERRGTPDTTYDPNIFSLIILFGKVWQIISAFGNSIQIIPYYNNNGIFPTNLASGTQIQYAAYAYPNTPVGVVAAAAVSPTTLGSVVVTLQSAYTGAAGAIVYLGTGQYRITANPVVAPGTPLITLINLSDTTTAAYNFTQPFSTPLNTLPILSIPELPAGRMGAYGLGQNWISLTDGVSFICSDISRGASGTTPFDRRDAVLKTVDITFLGGNFAIPGAGNIITSMTFMANLDTALGQGSLQIGTNAFMASCTAPMDFTSPPTSGPILTFSLIGSGPLGQNSTILVNSDIYFRSIFGFGSLILARRDFGTPGNAPISDEVRDRLIEKDNQELLSYGSSIVFDNRWLITLSPQPTSQGVLHAGLIALNLDPVSGMRDKQPPVYDGLWTGVNVLQLLSGTFSGSERAFAFTFNTVLSKIELYELLRTSPENHFDNGNIPIVWTFETASLFQGKVPDGTLLSLRNGEFSVSDVIGTVRFEVFFKSDQGCWAPWHSFSICSDPNGEPQYFPRLGLGEPDASLCDPVLNYPLRDGLTFQFKWKITGHCKFLGARFSAVTIPGPKFQPAFCDVFATVTTTV